MKKLFLVTVLTVLTFNLYSQNYGLGGELEIDNASYNYDGSDASTNSFTFKPFLRVEMTDTFAIEPYIELIYETEEDSDSSAALIDDDSSQLGLGFGSSVLKSVYTNDFLTLNFGASAGLSFEFAPTGDSATEYDSYSDITLAGTGFIAIDASLTENLKVRLGHNIIRLNANTYSYEFESGYEYSKNTFFTDTIYNGFYPQLSIYYMF